MNATAWQGPPDDILGHPAAIQQFVARTDHAVVALQQVIAFPEGCTLTVHVAARRGALEDSAWAPLHGGTPTDTDLMLGVRFPDGSKATPVDNAFPGWARPTDRPEPPMLVEVGGESSSTDRFFRSNQQLWLWPLPPPGPFEFAIEWPSMGIAMTLTTLDGGAIVAAAEHALPYWP